MAGAPVFLPWLSSLPEPAALSALSRIGPLLVPSSKLSEVSHQVAPATSFVVFFTDATIPYDDAIACLNAGAEAVVSSDTSLVGQVPANRLILVVSPGTAVPVPEVAENIKGVLVQLPTGVSAADPTALETVRAFRQSLGKKEAGKVLYVLPSEGASAPKPADVASIWKADATLVVPVAQLTLPSPSDGLTITETGTGADKLSIPAAFTAPLVSDRSDGLFPTLVVSASNHHSLGLVYSSSQSLGLSIVTGSAVYQSRKHGLWRKGETSGATQEVLSLHIDCDADAIEIRVRQKEGTGFCHLGTDGCFGSLSGLAKLESTLKSRLREAPEGSYTHRLFKDEALLKSKIMEEAEELCDASAEDKEHVAFEAADLFYFALTRCIAAGVSLADIERKLDEKSRKVTRRKGDAKGKWANKVNAPAGESKDVPSTKAAVPSAQAPPTTTATTVDESEPIKMQTHELSKVTDAVQRAALFKRPAIRSEAVMSLVRPILSAVRDGGDKAVLELTAKFDKAKLDSPVLLPPFYSAEKYGSKALSAELKGSIDQAYANIRKFHAAQRDKDTPLEVETMPGVVCRRFSRPIARVGLYVPGGTAVLPSTALMLGVPAQVAQCPTIVLATPPLPDGSISAEVAYVADLVGASQVVRAGGAQAVGAMAYGTETVSKVDKIVGPGNQFVTAAKMLVQNELDALVSIDMPAGPSEVLVMADATAQPAFVASDLLSQAEHGPDSQVVLLAISLPDSLLSAIEAEVDAQAHALPRSAIARQAISKSLIVRVDSVEEAVKWSNEYAPEHLIIHVQGAEKVVDGVTNAGSVFVGPWTPESCGDYASGTNHTLPTYGFARQYSGVSYSTFTKNITSQQISKAGLDGLGPHVVRLAETEGLEGHANAVRLRLKAERN